MRKHIFYNTVNFQSVTFRILFFRGIQTLQMRLSRKACFWLTQLLRPFCRAADELHSRYYVVKNDNGLIFDIILNVCQLQQNFKGFQTARRSCLKILFVNCVWHLHLELGTVHTLKRCSVQSTHCTNMFPELQLSVWWAGSVCRSEYNVKLRIQNAFEMTTAHPEFGGGGGTLGCMNPPLIPSAPRCPHKKKNHHAWYEKKNGQRKTCAPPPLTRKQGPQCPPTGTILATPQPEFKKKVDQQTPMNHFAI